jgi:DNA-binding transcriptional ArsR family regulator
VDLSVVSRHLGILKKSGVLKAEKKGKEVFYSINSKELVKSLRSIADFIENCCKEEK